MKDYLENPENIKKLRKLFYASLILAVAADFFVRREHVAFFWDKLPGFSAVYGLISCILIIVVSKALGHKWLIKKEDYYD
jgi:hypothetical protein